MLYFHYQNLLRDDLLLKLNCSTVMQVPQVLKIICVCPTDAHSSQAILLAMELICGQKFVTKESQRGSVKSSRVKKFLVGVLPLMENFVMRTTLRGPQAYNFLSKLITLFVGSNSYYSTTISEKSIIIHLSHERIRVFPEVQNSFEIFESMKGTLSLTIVTSATTREENVLLWTGLLQKEIFYV